METPTEIIRVLPHAPGVYLYKDINGTVIYVGKAKDLKRRVSQYFQRDDAVGAKTNLLVSQICSIETIKTASEFDAILLEAKLIHDYSPKFNVVLKDDKSPLYILLTLSEILPRILFVRRSDLPKKNHPKDALFGPFQSSRSARMIMRTLRYSIPYCLQKQRNGTPCFYTHLRLCNPCASVISGMEDSEAKNKLIHSYRVNIFRLKDILSGKSTRVLSAMEKDMRILASEQRFEEAAETKSHIDALRMVKRNSYDPTVYIESNSALENITENELLALQQVLKPYFGTIQSVHRIECIDISNTQGSFATGSLVVLTDGRIDTSQYRRFRIRQEGSPNDFAMIFEVVKRRFEHEEWGIPDLLLIDGGKGQVNAAITAVPLAYKNIPIIGLAKRFEEIIVPYNTSWKTLRIPYTSSALHILERIRDESHRFALSYHRLLRKKAFLKP